MKELAKRFIGKNCVVYFFDGGEHRGIITEVMDSAIMIEKKGNPEALNLDFIIRIKEAPQNKK